MPKSTRLPSIIAVFIACLTAHFMKWPEPAFWILLGVLSVLVFQCFIEDFSLRLFVFRWFTDRRLKQADDLLKSDLESTWGSSAYSTLDKYNVSPGSFAFTYGYWRFHVDRVIYESFFPETKNEDRPFRKGNLPKLEQIPGKHDFKEFLKDDIAHLKKIRKEKQKEDFKSKIKFWHLMEILFTGEWGYWKGTYGTKD